MFVVAIHSWNKATPDLVQSLADALGLLIFEARQRMIGGGPAVVANFADPRQADELARTLTRCGIAALVVDATKESLRIDSFTVRRFVLDEQSVQIETVRGTGATISYGEIDLLLAGTSIIGSTGTRTVTERKLSLGKTMLAGGIPIFKKVETQEEVTSEERGKVLYLYAGDRPPAVFTQNGMTYDGFGAAMKLSRELNFSFLLSQLRLRCPTVVFDDRLLHRAGQVRLLGPSHSPETSLDLAAEILARSLLPLRSKRFV